MCVASNIIREGKRKEETTKRERADEYSALDLLLCISIKTNIVLLFLSLIFPQLYMLYASVFVVVFFYVSLISTRDGINLPSVAQIYKTQE